jgi:polyisoprenoid-binding protein YceI
MKSVIVLIAGMLLLTQVINAQNKFYTKNARVHFFSKAPLEDIEAKSKTAVCLLDSEANTIQFSILIKSFEFENELMQEHFNDDYLESHKFPKAEFKGVIVNNGINLKKSGIYPVIVKGRMTIHGETNEMEAKGTIAVNGDNLLINSSFPITLADYKIKIPSLVKDKIAKTLTITVDGKLEQFTK